MIQPAWNTTAPHRRQLWLNLQNHRGQMQQCFMRILNLSQSLWPIQQMIQIFEWFTFFSLLVICSRLDEMCYFVFQSRASHVFTYSCMHTVAGLA